jgi:CRP-like cAMP-binding protein
MIIEDLPANLSQKLIQMIYSEKIENNSFFEGKPKGFTDWVTPFLQPVRHNKNELVVREGEFASEMFLIYKGEVNYVFVKNGSFYPYGNLAENYYFGEVDILFSEKKNYLASVFTETGCELLSLSREKFEEMIEKFEDEAIEICMKAKERLERMNKRQEEIINAVEKTIDFRENDLSSDKKRELFEHRTVRRSVENNALFRSNSAFNKIKKLKNHDNHLPKIKSSCEKISLFSENIKGMSRDLVELMYAKGLKYD